MAEQTQLLEREVSGIKIIIIADVFLNYINQERCEEARGKKSYLVLEILSLFFFWRAGVCQLFQTGGMLSVKGSGSIRCELMRQEGGEEC